MGLIRLIINRLYLNFQFARNLGDISANCRDDIIIGLRDFISVNFFLNLQHWNISFSLISEYARSIKKTFPGSFNSFNNKRPNFASSNLLLIISQIIKIFQIPQAFFPTYYLKFYKLRHAYF